MSKANIWRVHLEWLADEHEGDGLISEGRDLRHGAPHVTDEATFRAVVAAVCWWDEETIRDKVSKIVALEAADQAAEGAA